LKKSRWIFANSRDIPSKAHTAIRISDAAREFWRIGQEHSSFRRFSDLSPKYKAPGRKRAPGRLHWPAPLPQPASTQVAGRFLPGRGPFQTKAAAFGGWGRARHRIAGDLAAEAEPLARPELSVM